MKVWIDQDLCTGDGLCEEIAPAVFTLLDDGSASLDPLVYDWLDDWLAGARHDVHVIAMHIPPLDPIGVRNGAFASRSEAAKLLGRLAEGHVDLTLYGDIHSYYEFDNAGIPAFISGGGGAIPERFDGIGRHTAEGFDFQRKAAEKGFKGAVRERDEPFGDFGR